ncbi:MAG: 23S rRNA (uracil(1939)-C(5))-methyltransferase RlmD [Thermoanaerobacteraceae bacterium]|nr:23S rRNA (uracil(1939)-C(5))-methyltransferase RlmD [Thermoanaerobacteraceae bacterium]
MQDIKAGKKYEVCIDNMAHEGQGVGRIEGVAVFVEGALTGEKIIAEIDKVSKNYVIGHVNQILDKSPDRIQPLCPYAEKCGGCSLQHLSYKGQLKYKKQKIKDDLERIGKIQAKVHETIGMEKPQRYRNKAQFPVGMVEGKTVTGFYTPRSHDIIPIESCMIQHEISDNIATIIRNWIKEYGIYVYDEKTGKGLIRHVVTRVAFKTGEVMAVIVINGKNIPCKKQLIHALKEDIKGLKSVVLNINTKRTNVIMGEKNITIYGSDNIIDYINDIKFEISPLSFFQVNPVQTEVLYGKALEYADLNRNETVIDVYCGIGTISLFAAQKASFVYGIEVIQQAVEDAKRNARINGIKNVEFISGEAEKIMPELAGKGIKADVIIMDPPRKGCNISVLEAVVKMNPEKIVYVSCNPSTLARDLKYLEDNSYKTIEVQPVDMFPFTYHVECVVNLQRK